MRDQLYKIMKQVGDPTAFTEMLNDVQSQIDKEEAAMEQKNVDLDNARYAAASAVVDYIELLFGEVTEDAAEKDEMVDKICDVLRSAEEETMRTAKLMEQMSHFMPSMMPAHIRHDAMMCDGKCENCGPVCESTKEPEDKITIKEYKVSVRPDVDVDTVIKEFLESLQ